MRKWSGTWEAERLNPATGIWEARGPAKHNAIQAGGRNALATTVGTGTGSVVSGAGGYLTILDNTGATVSGTGAAWQPDAGYPGAPSSSGGPDAPQATMSWRWTDNHGGAYHPHTMRVYMTGDVLWSQCDVSAETPDWGAKLAADTWRYTYTVTLAADGGHLTSAHQAASNGKYYPSEGGLKEILNSLGGRAYNLVDGSIRAKYTGTTTSTVGTVTNVDVTVSEPAVQYVFHGTMGTGWASGDTAVEVHIETLGGSVVVDDNPHQVLCDGSTAIEYTYTLDL